MVVLESDDKKSEAGRVTSFYAVPGRFAILVGRTFVHNRVDGSVVRRPIDAGISLILDEAFCNFHGIA